VFAQLFFNGTNEGIHAFLVRIREEDFSVSPGVVIQDMGHKVQIICTSKFLFSCRSLSVMALIMENFGLMYVICSFTWQNN
jgi:acyl-CoA oxidase